MSENFSTNSETAVDDGALPTDSAVDAVADSSADSSPELVAHRFSFRGNAAEYFKIWFVNILLSILTLGFYSAWAKVRNRRYFYTNTFLDGANFDYHASPISILIARIIVILVLLLAQTLLAPDLYGDKLGIALGIFFFLFLPWAWVRGLSFNARNSSYRNVRFSFRRAYGMPYLFYGAVVSFVGWLIMPWLWRGYHRFKAERHQLGKQNFMFNDIPIGSYIYVYAAAFGMTFSIGFIGGYLSTSGGFGNITIIITFGILALYLLFWILAKLFCLFWNNVKMEGGAKILCEFTPLIFAINILMINFFAILFSLGLFTPWAQVRKARFLTENMVVYAPPALFDSIAAKHGEEDSAFGEEMDASQGFDFDVGII